VLDASGEVTHYLGMHRDVTEVHRLEQQVHNQKALIESVVDAAPVVTVLLDAEEQVVLDNMAYKKLATDMGGREPVTEFLAVLRESMGKAFEQARRSGKGFEGHEVSFDPGGHGEPRWFTCSGTWFRESDGSADNFFEARKQTYLLLVANEVTAIKRQQEQVRLNAMRALLAEDELVQGIRETLAGAIYQLQGPVNMIQAAAGMLRRRTDTDSDNDALVSVLEQAMAAGRRALETLASSMPAPSNEAREPVNINQLLRDVLGVLTGRLLASGVMVDWQPAPVLPALVGQPGRLRGMFKQVIDNALDAMGSQRGKSRELRIRTSVDKDSIVVEVEDTGPGIAETNRLRVFEPFYTTKGAAGGRAGMGLAMVQEVVNEHAGTVEVDPDYRNGCRFVIRFPMRQDQSGE
jgi:nitrogen fixation negative regulator NifL